jgi:hypothetical protein
VLNPVMLSSPRRVENHDKFNVVSPSVWYLLLSV